MSRGAAILLRWFIGDFTLTPQYFASSLSVNCHDSQFHRLPTISENFSETDCRDSLLTNSMQTYGR